MTEEEVLKKLENFKSVILKLKSENDEYYNSFQALKEDYDNLKVVVEKQKKDIEEFGNERVYKDNIISEKSDEVNKLALKINELTKQNIIWEEQFNKQRDKISALEVANRQLENRLFSSSRVEQAVDDLDEVVAEIKNDETHKMIVKPAERELQEMIDQS